MKINKIFSASGSNVVITTLLLLSGVFATAQPHLEPRNVDNEIQEILEACPGQDPAQFEQIMKKIASTGEDGIIHIAQKLTSSREQDITKAEYALGGFSYYVMEDGQENFRKVAENAFSKSLEAIPDVQVKLFLISQLQQVGGEGSVKALKSALLNEELCGPAARALIQINSPSTGEALFNALSTTSVSCQSSIIQALGSIRYRKAVGELTSLAEASQNKHIRKISFHALANIGDPSSGSLLEKEAQMAGFTFDETNAAAAYLLWAERMLEAGNTKAVVRLTTELTDNLQKENQVHSRIASLRLLAKARGDKVMQELLAASTNDNSEYRAAALQIASPLLSEKNSSKWVKLLLEADPEVKIGLINMLGSSGVQTARYAIAQELNSDNLNIRLAAIDAYSRLEMEAAVPRLLDMLKTAGHTEAKAIKNRLLVMDGKSIVPGLARVLDQSSHHGKITILEILGEKQAKEYDELVLKYINDENSEINRTAYQSLANVSTLDDQTELFQMLITSNEEEAVFYIQDAINKVLAPGTPSDRSGEIMEQYNKAPDDVKHRFYNLMASAGSKDMLNVVRDGFLHGSKSVKDAATEALVNWQNADVMPHLLELAKSSPPGSDYFTGILNGYIQMVQTSDYTNENKYLLLRELMEIARTPEQQRTIILEIGNTGTLPALFYIATFLDEEDLQKAAARAVSGLARSNPDYYGEEVVKIINEARTYLDGDYQIIFIDKHLSELPDKAGFVRLFNGKDLIGWKGIVIDPARPAPMMDKTRAHTPEEADEIMRKTWSVENGILVFNGQGDNISTIKEYGDFELYVDWKIFKDGDAGIYLRGVPQVQIWDTARHKVGAHVGSGGLYNNKIHESKPLTVADNPIGEWNTFRIIMKGEHVTVFLNGQLVVDNVILENRYAPGKPVFPKGGIELQAHKTRVEYRDIFLREITGSSSSNIDLN